MENKPEQAASLLENALSQQPEKEKIYLYLGYIYEQLGRHEEAVDILRRGIQLQGDYLGEMYFNLANNLHALEEFEEAEQTYTRAAEVEDGFAQAYLNRANVRVSQDEYQGAVDDYTLYLNLEPASSQRNQIEQVIAILERKAEDKAIREAEEEQRRREAEERRRAEEERRRQEEEERRKALLDSVLNSLDTASEETESASGGSEDIQEEEEQVDIID